MKKISCFAGNDKAGRGNDHNVRAITQGGGEGDGTAHQKGTSILTREVRKNLMGYWNVYVLTKGSFPAAETPRMCCYA